MTAIPTAKLRSNLFSTLELDTNLLTSQVTLIVPLGAQARYRGVITSSDPTKEFSLVVLPSPAEKSVTVDLSGDLTAASTFNVVENAGSLVLHVSDDTTGPRQVRIVNSNSLLFDNQKLDVGCKVVLRLLRPGTHKVADTIGGGVCNVTVSYPLPPPPDWDTTPVAIAVSQIDPKKPPTQMKPDKVSITPLQPLVFSLSCPARILTTLTSITDRIGNRFTETLTEEGIKLGSIESKHPNR